MAMIGEIKLFAGNYAPKDWALCDGQSMNIMDHQTLYCILGDKYGGDWSGNWDTATFELPRMADVPDSDGLGASRYIICVDGDFPAHS